MVLAGFGACRLSFFSENQLRVNPNVAIVEIWQLRTFSAKSEEYIVF
jgi:hypothetical protein